MRFLKQHVWKVIYHTAWLVCVAMVASQAQVWNWSQTATNNGNIDPQINWQTGMPPSAVDSSARSEMARIAMYRDDVAGFLTDTGVSGAAYVVASYSGSATPPKNGQEVSFVPANTNSTGVTFALDSNSAVAIQSPLGTAIPAGVMVAGTPYTLIYNTANSVWVLKNLMGNPYTVPIGAVIDYTGSSAPNSNFILPYGQAISRSTYATYYALVGTTYGTGDGVTTYNVPDLRGRVSVGLDNMGGSSASRVNSACSGVNTTLGGTCGSQTIAQANLPSYNLTVTIPSGQGSHTHTTTATNALVLNINGSTGAAGAYLGSPTQLSTNAATLPGMTGTAASGGSGTGLVQPTMLLNKILRIQ